MRRPLLLASVCLLAVTFYAYAGVVDHEFVGFDDGVYVSENPEVLAGLSGEGVRWAFTSGYAANWHPLTWLSHMLDVELFGVDPGAMARTNVLLHGLSSVLLLIFMTKATGAFWPSLLVALLFALHPLRVESVAWIAERKDVLSGLFWMTTLLCWLRHLRAPGVGSYVLVFVSLACGLMSKPVLVTLPAVLLLLDVWPLRRWRLDGTVGEPLGRLLVEKLPLVLLVVASSVVTMRVQAAGGAMRADWLSPLDHRLSNAVTSYVAYLGKTLWPRDLACFYPLPTDYTGLSPWTAAFFASLLLLVLVTGLAWRERVRRPWLGVGWLWYLGTLVPMIGLVQVGSQSMADRYAYLPTLGLYLMLAGTLQELGELRSRRVSIAIGSVALLAFLVLTPRQVEVWRDGSSIWRHALAVTEDNALAHYNLGTRLLRGTPRRISEARPHLVEAVRLDPGHPGARLNLGVVELLQGRFDEATIQLEASLRLDPTDVDAYLSLGAARYEQGRVLAAVDAFEKASALDPRNSDAQFNLGTVLLELGRREEARQAFERALEIAPGRADALSGLRAASAR